MTLFWGMQRIDKSTDPASALAICSAIDRVGHWWMRVPELAREKLPLIRVAYSWLRLHNRVFKKEAQNPHSVSRPLVDLLRRAAEEDDPVCWNEIIRVVSVRCHIAFAACLRNVASRLFQEDRRTLRGSRLDNEPAVRALLAMADSMRIVGNGECLSHYRRLLRLKYGCCRCWPVTCMSILTEISMVSSSPLRRA